MHELMNPGYNTCTIIAYNYNIYLDIMYLLKNILFLVFKYIVINTSQCVFIRNMILDI